MAIPSFPAIHVTGPVHTYCQTLNEGANDIIYLGTAKVTPQLQLRRYTNKTMNDRAGRTLPLQKHKDGEAATVAMLLTYFSKDGQAAILRSGVAAGLQVVEGQETRWSRGAAVYGQDTFKMWNIFENFDNPNGNSPGLEIGYFWPQVELLQHDDIELGAQGQGLLLVFDCTPYLIPQASNSQITGNERGWYLYSGDSNALFPGNPQGKAFPDAVRVPQ